MTEENTQAGQTSASSAIGTAERSEVRSIGQNTWHGDLLRRSDSPFRSNLILRLVFSTRDLVTLTKTNLTEYPLPDISKYDNEIHQEVWEAIQRIRIGTIKTFTVA